MKQTLIIVDDEESIRFGFEMILADQGYKVVTASDYAGALDTISAYTPDLVITDIILGGHTGIDLLAEIKNRGLACPVIMITGEPNIETSREAVRLGAFDYIPKPIRKDALVNSVRLALEQKTLLERKRLLENENARVRNTMEAIFGSIEDGIITVDDHMNVIEVNQAVEDICGLSPNQVRGNPFEPSLNHCSGDCIRLLKKTLATRKPAEETQVECALKRKSAQRVSLRSTPLKSDGIDFSGAVLVIRNITRLATLEKELNERYRFHRIIGKSSRMQEVYALIENLSDTDTTVLITGESGTGKELVAHAIHHNSQRRENAFVTVNCSALSENLLESELFGHVKGAFTGAVKDKKGRFEIADRGTLFLDEIGDISPLIQLKLLRVLQEKEFERVGDSTTVRSNVRVLAATNRDLKERVRQGLFREDLYYRIKVIEVSLPSLRDRRDDIPLLADHFLNRFNSTFKKNINGFLHEVMAAFMTYVWPGNIREFEHAIEHAFVLCQGEIICLEHLPMEIGLSGKPKIIMSQETEGVTKEALLDALKQTGWNKAKAARMLGIGRRTIYRKIDEFGIVSFAG